MSERTPIPLLTGGTREPVEAVLIAGVSDEAMRLADEAWQAFLQPILEERTGGIRGNGVTWEEFVQQTYDTASLGGIPLDDLPENPHWRWQNKQREIGAGGRSFAVECDGEVQGLMLTRLTKVGRLMSGAGRPLVYVDNLASAPWNLPILTPEPRFRKSGFMLMGTAIELSYAHGWEGRVGLHSLPRAEDFYGNPNKCGMTKLGKDYSYQGLTYFEMNTAQAREFLERIERGR